MLSDVERKARKAAYQKVYRAANQEKIALQQKISCKNRGEREVARQRRYYIANAEKKASQHRARYVANAEWFKARERAACARLEDRYVRRCMVHGTSLSFKDIPDALVEVKRLQLLIKRTCDEKRK